MAQISRMEEGGREEGEGGQKTADRRRRAEGQRTESQTTEVRCQTDELRQGAEAPEVHAHGGAAGLRFDKLGIGGDAKPAVKGAPKEMRFYS
jgi:hypothetical protein